jgi:glycosyltransferase involved in cell wall biosynthesis
MNRMKQKLFFIFPIKGPVNGVKIIGKQMLDRFAKDDFLVINIDTAQAKDFSSFGKFNLSKVVYLLKLLWSLKSVSKGELVIMSLTTKGFSFIRDVIIVQFLLLKKANITIHIHSNGLEDLKSNYCKSILNKVKKIVINHRQLEYLNQYNSLFYIPNALLDFSPTITFEKVSRAHVKLLYMSNISISKGIDMLYSICEDIKKNKRNFIITVCGGVLDSYSESIIQKISQDFDFVTFLGPVTDQEGKMKIYKNHDFLLFLSDVNYEVYPLVYIESLMNGLPIITTQQVIAKQITQNDIGVIINGNNYLSFIEKYNDPEKHLELRKKVRIKKNTTLKHFINL